MTLKHSPERMALARHLRAARRLRALLSSHPRYKGWTMDEWRRYHGSEIGNNYLPRSGAPSTPEDRPIPEWLRKRLGID